VTELRRVSVRIPRERGEEARALMLQLAPEGFEESDSGGLLELAAYTGDEGEAAIRSAFGDALAVPIEAGWEHRWRDFHRPVEAGGVWIGPPWEPPPPGSSAVVIDPGLAFGTGAHPTTRLCVELLATVDRGSLLDVGCGSGVLSIAGRRLGFEPVIAVDVDPVAVDVTRANAAANHVVVDVRPVAGGDLPRVDAVVANISLEVVEETLDVVDAATAVVSGYLVGERPESPGWMPVARRGLDGWAADLLRRGG
jgi:ribosomal protein L11 methyltransferase